VQISGLSLRYWADKVKERITGPEMVQESRLSLRYWADKVKERITIRSGNGADIRPATSGTGLIR